MTQSTNFIENFIEKARDFVGDSATRLAQSSGRLATIMKKVPDAAPQEEATFRLGDKLHGTASYSSDEETQYERHLQYEPHVKAGNKLLLAGQQDFITIFQKEIIDRSSEKLQRLATDQSNEDTYSDKLLDHGARVEAVEKFSFLLKLRDPELPQWREERDKWVRELRRRQFLDGSLAEIRKALYWMAERGGKDDLILLLQYKSVSRYTDTDTRTLIEVAEDSLRMRVYGLSKRKQVETLGYYRLFCSPREAGQLPEDIYLIEIFPAFSFVSISNPNDVLSDLQENYTVEALESLVPSSSLPNLESESKPMPMRDYIVRLLPQVNGVWRKRLEEAGAQLLQPLGGTDYLDFVVTIPTADVMQHVKQLSEVVWVGNYKPQIHINRLRFKKESTEATPATAKPPVLLASFFTAKDRALAEQQFQAYGIEILEQIDETDLALSVAQTIDPAHALDLIISQVGLRALEEEARLVLWNDVARTIIAAAELAPFLMNESEQRLPLTGRGEIIAIADTGLDTGDQQTMHLDLRGRIRDWQSYRKAPSGRGVVVAPPGSSFLADNHGHGTHVAGSVLGNGAQAELSNLPPIKGMAPEAELVFQSVGKDIAIPRNLKKLFAWAYDREAKIHSNSWGTQPPDFYALLYSRQLDEFVWEHKDFLVVVAAGNDARQSDHHQPFSQHNVSSPGTAKNCLTVGASEHDRPNINITYGLCYQDFSYEPSCSHRMTDSANHLAAFSSRGPIKIPHSVSSSEAPVRRRKPDVVAPGTFVLSIRSSQLQGPTHPHPDCWGVYLEGPAHYLYMSGTSMATPLVAGGAALVRQYLREHRQIESPSAALLKAAIIHSAQYLGDNQQNASGQSVCSDDEQGWGLVKLREILSPTAPKSVEFLDELTGLMGGQYCHYRVEIADVTVPFRATLVYTDAPDMTTSLNLINNLNLWVRDPQQKEYWGNDVKSDTNNNVEGVLIQFPTPGEWEVRIIATKVLPQEKQGYALVLSGSRLVIKDKIIGEQSGDV